ncbi:hypothetical protein GALL_513070 [mine drainage metagenome]|uniref:Uncharacterized protein n=1 Tax=mine drainage metagenome TaxID=410659 RepID=A0A1J5PU93_9ZZZZ
MNAFDLGDVDVLAAPPCEIVGLGQVQIALDLPQRTAPVVPLLHKNGSTDVVVHQLDGARDVHARSERVEGHGVIMCDAEDHRAVQPAPAQRRPGRAAIGVIGAICQPGLQAVDLLLHQAIVGIGAGQCFRGDAGAVQRNQILVVIDAPGVEAECDRSAQSVDEDQRGPGDRVVVRVCEPGGERIVHLRVERVLERKQRLVDRLDPRRNQAAKERRPVASTGGVDNGRFGQPHAGQRRQVAADEVEDRQSAPGSQTRPERRHGRIGPHLRCRRGIGRKQVVRRDKRPRVGALRQRPSA